MPSLSQRVRHIVGDSFGASIVEQNLEKAIREARERADSPGATFYDPMSMFMGREWLQKTRQGLGFQDLRQMARNPIINAIIGTRINQLAAFCRPQQDPYDIGYRVTTVDGSKPNDERVKYIEGWLQQAGMPGYGEDLLETLVRKFMRDSLVLDQGCAEIVYRMNGEPAYVVAVDAATIRKLPASLNSYMTENEDPYYCQVIDDQVKATFTERQMMFGIRNPQTDIYQAGYGLSELEVLTRVITTILNTERFNSGQVTQGGTAKGLLVVKSDVEKTQFDSFKRDFREAIRNASSYWRPPVLQIARDGEVEWVQLDRSNRDMEYSAMFDFLVKQATGVYQIDPSEINWTIAGSGTTTNFEAGTSQKQELSKKRGLRPLLTFLANQLNRNLIARIDPLYQIEFPGFETDRKEDVELRGKEVSSYRTVNEIRQEMGMEPIKGGDIILNVLFLKTLGLVKDDPAGGEGDDTEGVDLRAELGKALRWDS